MKIRRPKPRDQHETVVALIDVVFFLLVFFMVVGRMDATSPFDVTPPTGSTGSDMPAGGTTVSIAADGRQALDGQEADEAALLAGIGRALEQDPALLVRINAHRDAELGKVLPLVTRIEALGVRDVILVVTTAAP